MKWRLMKVSKMKILETDIEDLKKIDIVNNLVHLTIASSLYTEKVDPSKYTDAVWVNGKAQFRINTIKGFIDVECTALEWQATRTTAASFKAVVVQTIGGIKNAITGGTCCKN